MAKRTTRRGANTANPRNSASRRLWLAGLGALKVGGRRAGETLEAVASGAEGRRREARRLARDARDIARGAAITVGEQLRPRLLELGEALRSRLSPSRVREASTKRGPRPSRSASTAGGARKAAARRRTGERMARRRRG